MIIEPGAELTINPSNSLTIAGNLTNNAVVLGLIINSDASGTGSLIVSGTSTGNVIFKRHVDEATKAATWHYVSAPVVGQALDNSWMGDPNSIAQASGHYQFFRWDEPTNFWIIYGSQGTPAAFGDITFIDGRGYCLTRNGAGELSFTGTVRTLALNYGATFNADYGKGFNLVGNPFTSTIAITEVAQATDNFLADNSGILDGNYQALYIWNETSGYTYGDNDYSVICNTGFSGQGSSSKIEQDYVEPGQGFMVKTNQTGNIVFNTDIRKHGTCDYYKSKENWPGVELRIAGNNVSNSTIIAFNEDMTIGLDPSYDVGKMKGNPNIALYTRLIEDNGIDFAIQALPFSGLEEFEIPVGIDILETAIFKFSAKQEKLDNYNIMLEDRQENTFTNLRWDTYFAEVSESGTGRFYLHFKDATSIGEVLPQSKISCFAFNGKLIINNPENQKGVVSVTNITGQQLFIDNLSGSENQEIDLALTTGIYIVYFQTEISKSSKKIFIK